MNLVLLDADVIIDLHKFGLWEQATKKNTVYIASTIIHYEAYYYTDEAGQKQYFDLIEQIGKTIQEVSATPDEIAQLKSKFSPAYLTLDEGESESLAILLKEPDITFCTCDKAAIIALALLDMQNRVISLEAMLKQSGLTSNKLEPKNSEELFKIHLKKANQMKIQGTGLK